jgi:hypothetical protein
MGWVAWLEQRRLYPRPSPHGRHAIADQGRHRGSGRGRLLHPADIRWVGHARVGVWTARSSGSIFGLRLSTQPGPCACPACVLASARDPDPLALGLGRCLPGEPGRVSPRDAPRRTRPALRSPRRRAGRPTAHLSPRGTTSFFEGRPGCSRYYLPGRFSLRNWATTCSHPGAARPPLGPRRALPMTACAACIPKAPPPGHANGGTSHNERAVGEPHVYPGSQGKP